MPPTASPGAPPVHPPGTPPSYARPSARPVLAARFASFTTFACAFVAGVSLVVLAGWVLDVEALKCFLYSSPQAVGHADPASPVSPDVIDPRTGRPFGVAMNPLTAVSFLLCSVSLWLRREDRAGRPAPARGGARRAACVLAAAAVVAALLVLLWQIAGLDTRLDTHVDEWMFRAGSPPAARSVTAWRRRRRWTSSWSGRPCSCWTSKRPPGGGRRSS